MIATLTDQLKAKDKQIEALHSQITELQAQLRMVMDDKFYRPEISSPTNADTNKLHSQDFPDDVEQFDAEADLKDITASEDVDAVINRQIDAIASEHGFTGWAEEHKA